MIGSMGYAPVSSDCASHHKCAPGGQGRPIRPMETDMRAQQVPVSADMFRVVAAIAETLQRPRAGADATTCRTPNRPIANCRSSWLDRLEHWAWRQRQRDTEAY